VTLHKSPEQNSKLDSTVAYQVSYYPWSKLGAAGIKCIAWHKTSVLTKRELLEDCNDDKSQVVFLKDGTWFKINWEFNNIPTEQQWNDLASDTLLRVQFRISSFCGGTGRVAILSVLGIEQSELRGRE
jgi:hypothetical protein